ncbi:hypothetical protein [Ruficoccus amylovorans]|uniref:hypothetical protein n=1 Tax=Ruficoccus amylovorans TaxID=1804625 RepID=UPI001FE6D122|nr:hypothetical protein [Ruficoccus amylovorans]
MSSIHKTAKSRYWQMAFRDANGRQVAKSTKIEHTPDGETESERKQKAATNKRLAKSMADRAEEACRGNLVARHWREIAEDVVNSSEELEYTLTENYLRSWLASVETRKASGTYKRYESLNAPDSGMPKLEPPPLASYRRASPCLDAGNLADMGGCYQGPV